MGKLEGTTGSGTIRAYSANLSVFGRNNEIKRLMIKIIEHVNLIVLNEKIFK